MGSDHPHSAASARKKTSRGSDTFQLLSARWQRTNQAGCGHRGGLDTGGSRTGSGRRELLEVVATDPHLGSVFLCCRWSVKFPAEIREQKATAEVLPGGGFRLRPAPEEGSGTVPFLGPAPRLPAQRPDCLPAADVPLLAAAQRGFSALLNDRSVPFPSGRSRCDAPALARSAAAGNLRAAGRRPEKGPLCAGHEWPFPIPLEISKGNPRP